MQGFQGKKRSMHFLSYFLVLREYFVSFHSARSESKRDSNPIAVVGWRMRYPLDYARHNVGLSKCRI